MQIAGPTKDEWKNLFDAARMFKELEPWKWMEDSDLFGVEDPETGEIGYCCVMGALDEVLGFVVYMGNEGLAFYETIQSGGPAVDQADLHAMQNCLSLTFEDREMMEKKDLEVIKALGLRFRGRRAWPLLRNHVPGFVPWYLNGREARYMDLALRQAAGLAERLREKPGLLEAPGGDRCLVLYREKGGDRRWREKWVKPTPYTKKKIEAPVDELRLARIKAGIKQSGGVWEADFFFAPLIVAEGERPFFPYVALYTVHGEDYALNFSIAAYSDFEKEFSSNFMEFLEKKQIIPKVIMVRKDVVHDFLKPMAEKLGVAVKRTKGLKSIEKARDSLLSFISR